MNDFAPEIRNTGIWATDARRIIGGKAAEVYLERIGELEPKDLSDVEAVEWGHRLEESIARAAADKLRLNIKQADYALTHPKHEWMKSHFDYITEDGKTLLEIKNYGHFRAKEFGESMSQVIPAEDMAQVLHEAAVHNVTEVWLCVLFGGQELRLYPITTDPVATDVLIQTEAEIWGNIQTRTPPPASSPETARLLHPRSRAEVRTVGEDVAAICQQMNVWKKEIKVVEKRIEEYQTKVQNLLGEADTLCTPDGRVLATWKSAKDSRGFDKTLFQQAMPDIYEQFVVTKPGTRRFLVK